MVEPQKLLEQLSSRVEVILGGMFNPQPAMNELLGNAENAGLIDAPGAIRTDSPSLFAQDLLTDNPQAFEWAQTARESLDPLKINDLPSLLDAIQ